ncbi:15328_t:CDS:1 [Acaulospora morrowiae]|uniref:15328_t:CDS:1 n=1 Tax=Acaulospora morrowiae TaxID=94023 RepID=A0A9N8ZEZ2_9GLOM|nr:15328_t:CDS:1 [Acaulospora morrowiae]
MIIADLGLGKELDKVPITSASDVQGMPAYVEPQVFRNTKYKRDKRSDIYSLGVLLWEISSGVPPFKGTLPQSIPIIIYNGTRELPVIGTPSAYVELYTKCWSDNPKDRPDIVEVIDFLDEVPPDSDIKSSQPTIKVIESDSRSMNIKQEDTRLTNFSSSASASFLQVNRGSSLNISENWNHIQLSNDALGIDKKDNPMRNADSSKNLDSKEYRKSVISNLSKEIFELQLICTRKGSRKSWKDMITWIENNKSNAREIFEFFNNNDFLHREVILGNFHSIGFGTERNLHEAFRCFIKASKGGDRLGDYEVALCYEKGIGVTKDIAKAIYFYEKVSSTEIDGENSHDDGVVNAKYMLGMIYSNNDVGDKKMDALKLVKSAAEGGYAPAQHYLSQYYQSRDLEKALEWADRCEKNGGWK